MQSSRKKQYRRISKWDLSQSWSHQVWLIHQEMIVPQVAPQAYVWSTMASVCSQLEPELDASCSWFFFANFDTSPSHEQCPCGKPWQLKCRWGCASTALARTVTVSEHTHLVQLTCQETVVHLICTNWSERRCNTEASRNPAWSIWRFMH
jgi:hypothetical protein